MYAGVRTVTRTVLFMKSNNIELKLIKTGISESLYFGTSVIIKLAMS
jgi:hypothetical protein